MNPIFTIDTSAAGKVDSAFTAVPNMIIPMAAKNVNTAAATKNQTVRAWDAA
jgi:hypothetical protein